MDSEKNYFLKVFRQIVEFMASLSPGKKVAGAMLAMGIVVGLGLIFFWAGDRTFKPLMTNLSAEDSAAVIRVLRDKQIPFRVDATGKDISVPPEWLDQLRLELATSGVIQSSVVGYEVFDKTSLGTTSFVQKVNQKRALEGELMRTIGSIHGVRRSRVHLAIPQKSTFIEDRKKSTASVVLDLDPGVQLSEKQVFGIGNMVASAVEGMDVGDVMVVDSNGKTLSKNQTDSVSAETATQFEFRQKIENDAERRVEAMLSRIVGDGRVVARVSADVDFAQVSETQTTYDADGTAVLSRENNSKTMEGSRPAPGGAVGAVANTPGETPDGPRAGIKNDTRIADERINYKVPETVRRTVRPSWQTKRLSVAIVLDGKQVKVEEAGKQVAKSQPWTPEQIKEFEGIVTKGMGLDMKRGDTLEVRNMEFTHVDFEEAQRMIDDAERKGYIRNIVMWGVVGLIIMLFFLFVVRPFMKWVTENTIDSVDSFLPQTIEELERMQKNSALPGLEETMPVMPDRMDPEKVEGEMIKEKIITLVDSNPHKAALILRDWLHEPRKKVVEGEEKSATAGKGA